MNLTHVSHMFIALLILSVVYVFTRNAWVGAALAIGFYTGREHAQREYKIGDPSHLMPWEAFDVWNWSLDARLDLFCPIAAAVAAALLISFLERRRHSAAP